MCDCREADQGVTRLALILQKSTGPPIINPEWQCSHAAGSSGSVAFFVCWSHDDSRLLEKTPMAGLAGKTILIVEDDEVFRAGLASVLRQEGCIPVLTANGRNAIDYLTGSPAPDLILLAMMTPVMDGWSFSATPKARPEAIGHPGSNRDRGASSKPRMVRILGCKRPCQETDRDRSSAGKTQEVTARRTRGINAFTGKTRFVLAEEERIAIMP